jgi:hypothetical protein
MMVRRSGVEENLLPTIQEEERERTEPRRKVSSEELNRAFLASKRRYSTISGRAQDIKGTFPRDGL